MRYLVALFALSLVACSSQKRPDAEAVGAGDTGIDGSHTSEPKHTHGVNPRWVLVNSKGKAVKAIIDDPTPHIDWPNSPSHAERVEFFKTRVRDKIQCVELHAIGDRILPASIPYELGSGDIAPCLEETSRRPFLYDTASCNGQKYLPSSSGNPLKKKGGVYLPRGVLKYGSEMYGITESGECKSADSNNVKNVGGSYAPAKPLPNWIKNALPDPPYELQPRY